MPLTKFTDSLTALPLIKFLDLSFNSLQNIPMFPPTCPLEHLDLSSNLLDGTSTRGFDCVSALRHLRLQVVACVIVLAIIQKI